MIFTIKKNNGKRPSVEFNLIPKLDIGFILQLIAVLTSWALHESVIRSLIAYLFGTIYLVSWLLFGDAATKEGFQFIVEYYKSMF